MSYCNGLTKAGNNCQKYCLKNEEYCHLHINLYKKKSNSNSNKSLEINEKEYVLIQNLIKENNCLKKYVNECVEEKEKIKLKNKNYKIEIQKLNTAIIVKNDNIKVLKEENLYINKELKKLENHNECYLNELKQLRNKISLMEEDFNKYQYIKEFEQLKKEIQNININDSLYNILNKIQYSNIIYEIFNIEQKELEIHFKQLRNKRITYAHCLD